MNNIKEQDELFSSVEPPVSYYSSSLNCGVTAIFSNKEIKSLRKMNSLFTPVSPKNNFSLCNTIMWPFIINEKAIESDNYNKNINKSATLIKEKELNHISNTRNKTISSKSENKEYNDFFNGKIIVRHDNTNLEKNPYFMGKNLSTNFLIDKKFKDEEFNLRYHNANNESDNNNSKIEGDFKDYMNREQCKSVNINDVSIKNSIIKDDNKKEKSEIFIKKGKKAKIKDSLNSQKKYNKKVKEKVNKIEKKKSFFCREQSRSFIEELKKEDIQKPDKIKMGMNNLSCDKKGKNFYYSNKMINKNYNENYFKIIIKQNNCDKIEEEEKENKNKKNLRTERKKKKKNDFKNSLKNNSIKGFKIKFNERNIKQESSHFKQGLNILKEHIKNKDQNDNSSHDDSINDKDDIKKAKTKRIRRRTKEKEKSIKDSDSEEKIKIKTVTPNRRISGFTFNKKFRRRNSDNENSQSKTVKTLKPKNNKDKDTNSKSHSSLKESNAKKSLVNSLSKKEIDALKNTYDEKENVNKVTAVLRRKRSISMHLEKSKIKEVAEAIKIKKPQNETNLYSLSTNKIRKYTQKKFDFESALKKNLKKMQFNLFSKDKFTNTEFSDSDYLKYTLNCMELILELDIEKQTRLKNKINFNFPKPKKKGIKKRIALFDLDETLVHCTGDINVKKEYQHAIEIKLPGKQAVKVGINLRPYWKQTLNLIKKHYHIVIYTASHQAYADSVLDFMDPKKKYFKYRLYRNNCSLIDIDGAKFYVKDLDILNEYYDLKDIVIVDNSVLSFAYHLQNGIPIVPYYDEDKDGSLYVVGLYLIHIFPEEDLREANKKQINLNSFLEEAKKQKENNENIIDEESDDEEEDNSQNNTNNNMDEKKNGDETKRNKDIKKKSDKILSNLKKKNYGSGSNSPICQRRDNHDLTQKKLISQSKLINLYYEVNDESSKHMHLKTSESNGENKNSEKVSKDLGNLNLNIEPIEKNKEIYNDVDDIEFDCKSDPGNLLFDLNNKNSDKDSDSDEEHVVLKRGYTIIEDDYKKNNLNNNNIKGKLRFIRSNFYNSFKI